MLEKRMGRKRALYVNIKLPANISKGVKFLYIHFSISFKISETRIKERKKLVRNGPPDHFY
ncbi:MAG: hypothetical protein ACK56F_29860, partial [bacterium]